MSYKNNFFPLPEGTKNEEMDADVLIIGGGAAGLSCAMEFQKLYEMKKSQTQGADGNSYDVSSEPPMIMVLEKASEIGAHSLSGAVLNPVALRELIPNYKELNCPIESDVKKDAVYFLTAQSAKKLPIVPPPFHNEGNHIISLAKFNRWLAGICEQKGINIFPGFSAVEVLYDGDQVIGVRTGDKGRDQNGVPKANFEPGIIIKAKVVIFAEGTRGSLFKTVCEKLNLRKNRNPEVFEEGVKEVIQCPANTVEAGQVIHTMGFPLSKSVGGSFIYTLPNDKIIVGLVTYLDTKDPLLDPHRELQKLKTHPFIFNMIKGGKVVAYGGKTLPAGGWYSIPTLSGKGWMVVGDSASFVDVQKLKGIHLAMKSGMLAAKSAFDSLYLKSHVTDTPSNSGHLRNYDQSVENSYIKTELYRVRNFHQTLSKGIFSSLPLIALQEITGGRGLFDNMKVEEDYKTTATLNEVWGMGGAKDSMNKLPELDGTLFMDKLSSVYLTGTMHDEHSPNHLILKNSDICRSTCEPKYKSPCNHFCPASVYEMIPSEKYSGQKELKINYTNCIHCKTCDIKCPFENIDWTPPEGGGGPSYVET